MSSATSRSTFPDAPPGWDPLADLTGGQSGSPPDRTVDDGDDLYQLYTSGTTGAPKGAVLSHRAVTANLVQIAAGPHHGPPGERAMVVVPMCHAGVVWSAFAPLLWGACLVIESDFDPARLVRLLDEQRIGYAALVPAILQACLPHAAGRTYPALRLIHTGSAPITPATLRATVEVFGCDIVQGYGLTETTAGLTTMTPADTRRGLVERSELLGSVGRCSGPSCGSSTRTGRQFPPGRSARSWCGARS